MKEEPRRDQLASLQKQLEQIEARIGSIPGELQRFKEKIGERKYSLEVMEKRIEDARKERQDLLASGKSPEQASQRLEKHRDEFELLEDEIAGMERKIKFLQEEEPALVISRKECKEEIFKIRLAPLVEEYNQGAEKVGLALQKVCLLLAEFGIQFGEDGLGRFIKASQGRPITAAPRWRWPEEQDTGDFFNVVSFYDGEQKKSQDKFFAALGQK